MIRGMIGRKLGMTRLYDGSGRVRPVTVIEVGPNRVTQLRTEDRDGYEAVQIGYRGDRKRMNRPERGHLRASSGGNADEVITVLQEFPADDISEHALGDTLTVDQFEPGQFVNVSGVSKGRGFAGSVKRWGFHGGPKTHGQSDRHRAPGSIGAGTTPGKVWRGQKMAGHMGARTVSVLNLLVVQTDMSRNLIFVEGSVPGPNTGIVTVTPARRPALASYEPPPPFEVEVMPEVSAEEPAAEQSSADEAVADDVATDEGAAAADSTAPDDSPDDATESTADASESADASDTDSADGDDEPTAGDADDADASERSE